MHARGDEQQEQAHSSSNVYRADGVGLSCLCVRALSCMSCAKRARRLKIVLRSGNICTNVIAGSGRSVALRRCHTGNAPRSSSVNQLCLPPAASRRREDLSSRKGTLQALRTCNARQKIAWRRSCPVEPASAAARSGAGPHPHLLPGLHIIFCLVLRGVVAKRCVSRTPS